MRYRVIGGGSSGFVRGPGCTRHGSFRLTTAEERGDDRRDAGWVGLRHGSMHRAYRVGVLRRVGLIFTVLPSVSSAYMAAAGVLTSRPFRWRHRIWRDAAGR